MGRVHFGLSFALALGLASACGSGDDRAPAPQGDDDDDSAGKSSAGKSSTSGSSSTSGGAGSGADSSVGGDGKSTGGAQPLGGEGGAAGTIDYQTAGAPTLMPGVCDHEMMAGDEQTLSFTTSVPSPTLLSMTSDELSIAFVGEDALYVADRASTKADFAPIAVVLPAGYDADSGVSLSANGLRLIVVKTDHAGFGALTRTKRGEAFGSAVDTAAFAFLNSTKPMSGRSLGWPVLSNDGGTLYFISYFGQALVVQSTLGQNGVFSLGQEIDEYTLGGNEGEYKLINGVSVDQRAIFFFDEASGHAQALFRSRDGGPFYDPVDFGERRGVVPNADCNRLYSSAGDDLVSQPIE
jgi:hypothetical protein